MKHLKYCHALVLALMMLMVALATSCMDEQSFDTPSGASLRLSADTIYLDTVLTHNTSATKRFTIYNDNSKGVSITKVAFEGNQSNGFMINVDGTFIKGALSTPIDCAGKDSLFAFVQYNAQDIDQDEALFSRAKVTFTLANGRTKTLVLEAHTLDATVLKTKVISKDTTISSKRPVVIYDSLVVSKGAKLYVSPGTKLCFHSKAYLKVNGTLIARGTLNEPITFRGDRFDNMFTYQAYDDIYEQWGGITFGSTSYGNELDYCDIHAGEWGILCESSDVSRLKLKLENSIVHNMKKDVLTLYNCQTFVGNTQLTNAGGNCITVYGGDNQFVHCTIASFCPFTASRGNALVFYNKDAEEPLPITRLHFYNSIITGYASDEIYAYPSEDETVANNYGFFNCLLNTPEINDNPNVVNNVWENKDMETKRKDNFLTFDLKCLRYNFGLTEKSPARMLADPQVTKKYYPYDRLGRSRLNSTTPPDAGCYQYVEAE